jgi:cob(I)alamin adenosyltransferase
MKEKNKGLIIIFTGDGKGKTTAALGMALRGTGHHQKTIMIQFLKGTWKYGELDAAENLEGFSILPMGAGFICKEGVGTKDREMVEKAWEICKEKIESEEYDVVIMDEINYVIHYNLLLLDDVVRFLKNKQKGVHVILTGREAKPELIEIADLATEMKKIKHPYDKGIQAQEGIEF